MAYVLCKIHEEGQEPYQVKALIDTTSNANIISKRLVDKLKIEYTELSKDKYYNKQIKDAIGMLECLDLSFSYKGKDRLVTGSDEVLNDFIVVNKPKAELILGLQWLWLRETIIDIHNNKMSIYDDFIPLYD